MLSHANFGLVKRFHLPVAFRFGESAFYVINYRIRILAIKHILASVFESDEKAIGGFAIVSDKTD